MAYINIQNIKHALVSGASGAIGRAIIQNLLESNPDLTIFAITRHRQRLLEQFDHQNLSAHRLITIEADPKDEERLAEVRSEIEKHTKSLPLVIVTNGLLHNAEIRPEKTIRHASPSQLMSYFEANSLPAILLGKHLLPLLKNPEPSCFAAISAKVGSISDNQLGGWYGYRASKAALNMFLRCMHLEAQQNHWNLQVLAIHPGTTISSLSKPFIAKTKLKLHQPRATAENILTTITNSDFDQSGKFLSWDGSLIPW